MKTTNKLSGIALKVYAIIIVSLLTTRFLSGQGWYDADWLFRIQVVIPNTGTTELTDIQVKVNLDAANFNFVKAKSDGSDIRITGSDGVTMLPFWIESFTPASASIWVKVPSIPPTAGTLLYLYYGNQAASSASNGVMTFNFFDDFESWTAPEPPSIWETLAPIPTPSADLAVSVYDNKLYSFGGYGIDGVVINTVYEYDPAIGWTGKAPMPTGRWGQASVEFDGKIYVFGGEVASTYGSDANEIYDPVNNTWEYRQIVSPLAIPDYDATGVLHPDVIYFDGGNGGYEYWMVYTPYPPESEENPSIVRSHDGKTWTDAGITNPVIPEGADGAWNDFENADPDFLYVPAYNKWFMVWDGGDAATQSRRIALAYSTDGITWTQYDGVPVNGNTLPVILSGNPLQDVYAASWERDAVSGYSKTCVPSLFYEAGTFYLFYGEEVNGNNRGSIGLATFTWNNLTDDITSLNRNAGNPIISLPQDADFKSGGGHIDISKNTGTNPDIFHMYVVREMLGSTNRELALLTSSDLVNWTSQGKAIELGDEHQWDDTHIYRSCPVVNSAGEIVFYNGNIRMYYSAWHTEAEAGIGIAEITPTGTDRFSWEGAPSHMPKDIADQGLMGVRLGNKIHLFYRTFHYEYDPVTDTYERRGDLPFSRRWGTCAVVDGEIYLIGGHDGFRGTNTNLVWTDPVNDIWEQRTPMPVSLYGAGRENPVIDGKIYVTHGWNDDYFRTTNFMYDPQTDTWAQKGPALYPRDGVACGVINNRLYVVGGRDLPSEPDGLTYHELYDPALDTWLYGPSQWNTSGMDYVFANTTASYQGNYGLTIRHPIGNPDELSFAETVIGLGPTYALDFEWNVTSLEGISEPANNPQGMVRLTEEWDPVGNLYFYQSGVPVVRWYTPPMQHLQNSTWNEWHEVTIVRDGSDSQVTFDGNPYSSLITVGGGMGKLRFGAIRTTEYIDNVRVRKWAGFDPFTITGSEQFQGTQWTGGGGDSDWNNPLNWSAGIPGSTVNANILDRENYPIINGTNAICNNLIIDPLAKMTIASGGVISLTGVLTINSLGTDNSGSLINYGTIEGPVRYNRFLREGNNYGDRHLFSSPVGGQNIEEFLATYASKVEHVRIWNEELGIWSPVTSGNFVSGRGYSIYQTDASDGYFSFTGTIASSPDPVPGTSPYAQSYEYRFALDPDDPWGETHPELSYWAPGRSWINYFGGGWNLLGNPFSSAINSALFISTNSADLDPFYQALYVYDGVNGVYKYSAASVPGYPVGAEHGSVIQAGQGFFVLANNYGVQFDFDPLMQVHNTDVPLLKSTGKEYAWPGLQLKVKYGKKESLTTIVYNSDMTTGLDPGYDVGQMSTYPDVEIYTSLVLKDNSVNFARQALPIEGCEKNIVSVGIDTKKGGEVTFSAFTVPLGTRKFWLEDRVTGIYTNLNEKSFTVKLPPETYGTGRFYIIASAGMPKSSETDEAKEPDVRIWNTREELIIKGELSERARCEIFDMRGRMVLTTQLSSSEQNILELPSDLHGVYLVRVVDGLKIINKKIVIL